MAIFLLQVKTPTESGNHSLLIDTNAQDLLSWAIVAIGYCEGVTYQVLSYTGKRSIDYPAQGNPYSTLPPSDSKPIAISRAGSCPAVDAKCEGVTY